MKSISAQDISKAFSIRHEYQRSIRTMLLGGWKKARSEQFQALHPMSFTIERGEFFGIIGHNGSGKSTLLKILAGILQPDKGQLEIHGRISPFLELGVGFHEELTGRENIYMYGSLLGLSLKEITEQFDSIVQFAELERFIDTKLKYYSSGMSVRLAFSVAIRASADIYLLDEVLAVGDAQFREKCFDVFEKLKQEQKTIILVSHDLENMARFCNRVLWLDRGEIRALGQTEEVLRQYTSHIT